MLTVARRCTWCTWPRVRSGSCGSRARTLAARTADMTACRRCWSTSNRALSVEWSLLTGSSPGRSTGWSPRPRSTTVTAVNIVVRCETCSFQLRRVRLLKRKFHWDQFPRNFPVANVTGKSPTSYEEVTRKLTTFRPSRHIKMVWRVANFLVTSR